MNKTLLERQEGVLYFTSLALSMISTISSVASHSVQNPQTLQRFLSPLYNWAKDVIHHHLEGSWGVGETEEHDSWFEKAITCFKFGLVFIALFDVNIDISPANIQFSINVGASQVCDKVRDEGKRVLILYGAVVDTPIILDRA